MRLSVLILAAVLAGSVAPVGVAAQETETPSSRPAPSPGAPPPPVAPPGAGAAASSTGPDRAAAQAAVRAQCAADRARLCRDASDAGACLASNFAKLGADCQSAVTALKEFRTERGGG